MPVVSGYISGMTDQLRDLMAQLEVSLVDTVARLEQAEMELLYVGVLDLEERIEGLQDALALVADSIAEGSSLPIDRVQHRPRAAPPSGGARDQDPTAAG